MATQKATTTAGTNAGRPQRELRNSIEVQLNEGYNPFSADIVIRWNDTTFNNNNITPLLRADAVALLEKLQEALERCDWCEGRGALSSDGSGVHHSDPGSRSCSQCHGTGKVSIR